MEFSFFTLADSGAFVTHAPKYLSEVLALVRPFRWEVWPPLMITVALTGPAIYFVIMAPFWWQRECDSVTTVKIKKQRSMTDKGCVLPPNDAFNIVYLKEMSYGIKDIVKMNARWSRPSKKVEPSTKAPEDLLNKCIWFTITLFLRQCKIFD